MICLCRQEGEDISFTAGESRTLVWHLKQENGKPYDATGCTGNFSMAPTVDWGAGPALGKSASISRDTVKVELVPADTAHMPDIKYIYQLSLRTKNGEAEIAAEGAVYLQWANNPEFLLGGVQ